MNQDSHNCFSLFVDAAHNDHNLSYSTAYVIYDPGGKMAAAGYHKIQSTVSIMATELQAIKDGILQWKLHQSGSLRVFSDCLDAIHSIYSTHKYRGETLIHDIKDLIEDPSVKGD